jgi:hypothetical protein
MAKINWLTPAYFCCFLSAYSAPLFWRFLCQKPAASRLNTAPIFSLSTFGFNLAAESSGIAGRFRRHSPRRCQMTYAFDTGAAC